MTNSADSGESQVEADVKQPGEDWATVTAQLESLREALTETSRQLAAAQLQRLEEVHRLREEAHAADRPDRIRRVLVVARAFRPMPPSAK